MARKRALITGITGQDGSYLAEFLLTKGYDVFGMVRRRATDPYPNLAHLLDRVEIVAGDLSDSASLIRVVEISQPDEVYNLASQSFVKSSWELPEMTGDITGLGVVRLLEAVRKVGGGARFYQASSSEMFGLTSAERQSETTPFRPRSPYAAAKLYGHWVTVNYRESYGMFACCGILFNHESPRRGLEFVTRKIAHGAARIKLGLQTHLALGNLEAARDWGFAGDYVEAMWRMMQKNTPSDYVIGTGETHTVREFAEQAFRYVGLDYRNHVVQDERYLRPAEVPWLCADPTLATTELNWKPKMSFVELVHLMVEEELKMHGQTG